VRSRGRRPRALWKEVATGPPRPVARAVAALTGAFVNDHLLYLQSTGFVLDPQGKVIVYVYSSGAIGRFVPDDVIGLVRYLREHAAA
jgi:hypothetical protein